MGDSKRRKAKPGYRYVYQETVLISNAHPLSVHFYVLNGKVHGIFTEHQKAGLVLATDSPRYPGNKRIIDAAINDLTGEQDGFWIFPKSPTDLVWYRVENPYIPCHVYQKVNKPLWFIQS